MDNRTTINRYLGNRGLSTLDDASGLMSQLGYMVEDDAHFKLLLNRCDPPHRREMYEALRPHLRFSARPLDAYIAELGMEAEAQQLPVVTEDGKLRARNVPEVTTVIRDLVEESLSRLHLTLTCVKCTLERTFHGNRRGDVIFKAREAGWTCNTDDNGEEHEVCPACSGSE